MLTYGSIRQGETFAQVFNSCSAQAVVLSLWQVVQEFGILYWSVSAGGMKRKVWLRTLTSAIVCSICGMWQAMHSPPVLPAR